MLQPVQNGYINGNAGRKQWYCKSIKAEQNRQNFGSSQPVNLIIAHQDCDATSKPSQKMQAAGKSSLEHNICCTQT
jgi:hypothetical protein